MKTNLNEPKSIQDLHWEEVHDFLVMLEDALFQRIPDLTVIQKGALGDLMDKCFLANDFSGSDAIRVAKKAEMN